MAKPHGLRCSSGKGAFNQRRAFRIRLTPPSAATYGGGEHGFIDRDDLEYLAQLTPLNPYGWSKHEVDLALIRDLAGGASGPNGWAGFKFFNVYGPNEGHKGAMRSLVCKIVPQIEAGEPVQLFRSHRAEFADGAQRRDFIYVDDAVAAVIRTLHADAPGGLLNVGTGQARTFLDLALATYAAMEVAPDIRFIDMPDAIRDQYQYHTEADVTKAAAAGIHAPAHTLESGIAAYVTELQSETRKAIHA